MRISITVVRRGIQCLAIALLLVPNYFKANEIWIGNYLSSHVWGIPLTDPVAALEVFAATKEWVGNLLFSAIPLILAAVIFGRVFCSWVCPLNTLFEMASYIKKPAKGEVKKGWQPVAILGAFLLLSAVISIPVFTMISPIGIVSRMFAFGFGYELAVVIILIAMEWFYNEKYWCRRLCPVGALYGLFGRFRLLKIVVKPETCSGCGECNRQCSMKVSAGSSQLFEMLNCTNCGRCTDICDRNAVSFEWKVSKKGGINKDELITGAKG